MHDCGELKVFDIETTGLGFDNGIILSGLGIIEKNKLIVRQYLPLNLDSAYDALLKYVDDFDEEREGYIGFNCRSFDKTNILKQLTPLGKVFNPPCIYDMLHFVKSCFNLRKTGGLAGVEKTILGFNRGLDIPGFYTLHFYVEYLKNDNPAFLMPIIKHNQLDMLSTSKIFRIISQKW